MVRVRNRDEEAGIEEENGGRIVCANGEDSNKKKFMPR